MMVKIINSFYIVYTIVKTLKNSSYLQRKGVLSSPPSPVGQFDFRALIEKKVVMKSKG